MLDCSPPAVRPAHRTHPGLRRCIQRLTQGRADQAEFLELVRSRVYGILAGYADRNDHNTLRSHPVFKLIADRSPEDDDLASHPTLSRFENAIEGAPKAGEGIPPQPSEGRNGPPFPARRAPATAATWRHPLQWATKVNAPPTCTVELGRRR
jgi:hypothetical protein